VAVSTLTYRETIHRILTWAAGPVPADGPRCVFATGVHGLVAAHQDPAFRDVLNRAALLVPDGMPLLWFGRLSGCRSMERVRGPSLLPEVCAASAGRGLRHYFYGGREGVAAGLARVFQERFPGLAVAGHRASVHRPLTGDERKELAAEISATGADLVWVCLGETRQEPWAGEMRPLLRAKVILTVGAAFDFHAGRLREAPPLVQRSGFEWAYRLLQEPARLGPRYLRNNPRFLLLATAQLLGLRRFPDPET
jgi:N-acetylglucosaminyldiphosphoundecaprenol N-acetyl-beta-D-mannosaminyltransferase